MCFGTFPQIQIQVSANTLPTSDDFRKYQMRSGVLGRLTDMSRHVFSECQSYHGLLRFTSSHSNEWLYFLGNVTFPRISPNSFAEVCAAGFRRIPTFREPLANIRHFHRNPDIKSLYLLVKNRMRWHNRCADQKLKSLFVLKKLYFETFPQIQKSQSSANTTFSANTKNPNTNKQINNSRLVLQAHKIPEVTECHVHSLKCHQHPSIFEDFGCSRHLVHCLICSLVVRIGRPGSENSDR